MLARVLGVILEVYVKERASYKRISRLGPDGDHAGLPVRRLDYQDGQHFEILVPTQLPRALMRLRLSQTLKDIPSYLQM